jgi:hypothetical protein
MRKIWFLLSFLLFISTSLNARTGKPEIWVGLGTGYMNGIGGEVQVSLLKLSPAFPIGIHFSAGYYHQEDPGVAVDARKIFINDTTTGNDNIIEYGYNVSFLLEFSYPILKKNNLHLLGYVGASHVRHLANFDYVGGNEKFDVTTNPWGLSGGVRLGFFLTPTVLLSINGGVEFLFLDTISAHGNFYNPDGEDDNPRNDYTYDDADAAIYQPFVSPKIKIELLFKL